MLFPSPMKKVSFIVHRSDLEKTITALHESGLLQIIDISRENHKLEDIESGEPDEETINCINYENRLTHLIDILKNYRISRKGIKAFLSPSIPEKKPIKQQTLQRLYKEIDKLLEETGKKILTLDERMQKLIRQLESVDDSIKSLSNFLGFNINLSYIGESKYLITKAGITSKVEQILKEIGEIGGIAEYRTIDRKKERYSIIATVHISKKERLEVIWQKYAEDVVFSNMDGNPSHVYRRLQKERISILREMERTGSELGKIAAEHLDEFLAKREEIQIERIRREIPSAFGKTTTTYIIQGWVLERDCDRLKNLLEKITGSRLALDFVSPNPETPPTHLDIPSWMEPFKSILALFSLPKYNEINPTPLLVLWFPLLFGIMLGDAGYGVIILLLSIFARLKWGKISPFIKSWSFVGLLFGLWTVIFGFLFNSFFGDFVPRFVYGNENALLYHLNVLGYTLPLDALHKPLAVLIIALLMGLMHLNLGFILAMYQNYREGKTERILKEQIPWFLLEIGGGALIGKFLLHIWDLSMPMFLISATFSIVGLIALFVNNRAMGFFELTGFVGDWLSYARLLALGLATSGMALAFNIVAQLMPRIVPYIGIALLFVILIFAHLANLLIQSLGAAIHSLRLQYVEFFNRFYEGGGNEFTPFRVKRRYTEMK